MSEGSSGNKGATETMIAEVVEGHRDEIHFVGAAEEALMSSLVSSPGFGVIDSGCGKTLIGADTLAEMELLLGNRQVIKVPERNSFRFGNGEAEDSVIMAQIPVAIQGKTGVIHAAVIRGKAPLLLGRPTLEKLKMTVNFASGTVTMLGGPDVIQLDRNSAGQMLINLVQFPSEARQRSKGSVVSEALPVSPETPQAIGPAKTLSPKTSTSETLNLESQDAEPKPSKLRKRAVRKLLTQWKQRSAEQRAEGQPTFAVAELFSFPRFKTVAEGWGFRGLSFDKSEGWDLADRDIQVEVDKLLERAQPQLLVVCVPCGHWCGWRKPNASYLTPCERARTAQQARRQADFAVQQCHKQLKRGGQLLFEHSWSSELWRYPPVAALVRKFGRERVDMYTHNSQRPGDDRPAKRATGLMLSHPSLTEACRKGCKDHNRYTSEFEKVFLGSALGYDHRSVDCLCSFALEAEERMSLEGFECLAGEAPAGSHTAAEPAPAQAPPGVPTAKDSPLDPIGQALRKLHNNLGHPSLNTLIRVLKNSGASEEALQRAKAFSCTTCEANRRPADAIPARPSGAQGFNEKVGMDIKYLQGWRPGQKIPCLNIVDYGGSYQQMVPLPSRDTGELIRTTYRTHWLAWAGVPEEIVLDPSQPNLSESLCRPCEEEGSRVRHTAAEAHWQLGKVERHGGLFQVLFLKVLSEVGPESEEEWKECVTQTLCAKNSMFNVGGVSPCQFVFGRNPRIPTDLLHEHPNPIASDATQAEPAFERQSRVRLAARQAMIASQDCKALREALRARPRLRKDFESGQWVAYWRTQKSIKGQVVRACRWYGPALVLGRVGRNLIVAHRRSLLRCAPEQLRPATDEECPRTVESDPEAQELLGMKRLLDQGKIPQSQLTDITSQEFPPTPEECSTPLLDQVDASMDRTAGLTAAQVLEQESTASTAGQMTSANPYPPASAPTFGPVRTRLRQKTAEPLLVRPTQVQAEDLSDMLRELPLSSDAAVPSAGLDSESPRPSSPREPAFKRMASSPPDALRAMSRQESAPAEALFCQTAMSAYREQVPHATEIEVLLAGFLQKQMQKEIPVTGNPEDLQEQVEEAKATEWYAMTSKPAVKVWSGADATRIRRNHPDRFVGSRFVVTRKVDEDGERVKARWCLQGHLDPDVMDKVSSGACHSPTMSQLSRSLLLQILVSKRWRMCLGDIKGAFLEAGPLKERFRPLYATQPKGGIPGLAESDVIEVTGNVYGLNDAPFSWWEAFDKEARRLGFSRSQFDNCVYYFRCPKTKELTGVLGAHVDDSITGGEGEAYEEAIRQLKARFPYRKWRVGAGEFCGVVYNQDPVTFEISYQQREYTQHLRPISLSKDRAAQKDSPVTARELASLRALNGAASWLASQSRPDIAVQVSMSQQCFPNPQVEDLLYANQMVHRARQFQDVEIRVRSVNLQKLCICMHSDAAWANAKRERTQGGYTLAFSETDLLENRPSV